jgi:hypothetical protein
MNIGTPECPKIIKIGAQCSHEENQMFMDLFQEFLDVFARSYEDLRGFDSNIIQNAIPIKEGAKPIRQK